MNRAILTAGLLASAGLLGSLSGDAHACTTQNLTNWGGNVVGFPQAYAVYWGWTKYGGTTANKNLVSAAIGNTLDNSFGIGGTRWTNTESQYGGDTDYGFQFGPVSPINIEGILTGSYDDEHNVPAAGSKLNDTIVQTEVDYLVANGVVSVSKDTTIVLMLPPGFAAPVADACGQHFVSPGGNLLAWIPYPDNSSGCIGTTTQALTHELMETATDPLWNTGKFGWTQENPLTMTGTAGCEIGDLCEGVAFEVQVQPQYNTAGLPSQITTQPYWSNELRGCAYGRSTNAFVFGIGMDHKLWAELVSSDTTSTLYGWNSWGSPNANATTFETYSPGATSWGAGHVDVFAVDTAGLIDHASSDDSGYAYTWETLPALPSGFVGSAPDAVSWGAGNVQVFVRGTYFSIKGHPATSVIWSNTNEVGKGWLGWTNWANQQAPVYGLAAGVEPLSKISVASPMATNITQGLQPTSVRQVFFSFVDTTGLLQLGYTYQGQMFSSASVTPTYDGTPIAIVGDPEIASMIPGRLDVLLRDGSGTLYDCTSTDMVTILGASSGNAACAAVTSPGGFGVGFGAAGMGDGRLLMVGRRASGTGAYEEFLTPTGSTGWLGGATNGEFTSGLDVAAF